jgi:transglutaminase-like putative cysteine protease
MGTRIALNHRTGYEYAHPVVLGPQVVRLRPAPHCRIPIQRYSITVEPDGHFENWQQDPLGNFLLRLVFPERVDRFHVEVDLVADMAVVNPFDFFCDPYAEDWPFRYEPVLARQLYAHLEPEPIGPALGAYLKTISRDKRNTVDFLVALNRRLEQEIDHVVRREPGIQTCDETLISRTGSCRDTGWLLIQILRNLGLAARFVSGYLVQLVPDIRPLDGPPGPETDLADLHAWVEVYVPGAGWIGLDPTSGLMAGEGHIPLACAPDPASAAPVSGTVEPCASYFQFSMDFTRIAHAPQVTGPHSDPQGDRIAASPLSPHLGSAPEAFHP